MWKDFKITTENGLDYILHFNGESVKFHRSHWGSLKTSAYQMGISSAVLEKLEEQILELDKKVHDKTAFN